MSESVELTGGGGAREQPPVLYGVVLSTFLGFLGLVGN